MRRINRAGPQGIGGWLLLLVLLLLVWGPVNLGLIASSAFGAVAVRGAPVVLVLLLRVFVTAFGIAAGIALAGTRGPGVTMAKASLALSAATDVFVYTTPYFPSNRLPGDTPIYLAISLAYYGLWIAYLLRSARVRNTFQ